MPRLPVLSTRSATACAALTTTPMDFMARLAILVPPPYFALTRYHGVFAARSSWRPLVIPKPPDGVQRVRRKADKACKERETPEPLPAPAPAPKPPRPSAPEPSVARATPTCPSSCTFGPDGRLSASARRSNRGADGLRARVRP